MKIRIKAKEIFFKIWKDPVWSKVISGIILVGVPILWAKITHHSWEEIYGYIITILTFNFPLYAYLSAVALFFIVRFSIQWFKRKRDPFWDEQIGNYTFKELYNILLTETLPVRTQGMEWFGRDAPNDSLLFTFQVYYSTLNTGFGPDDDIQDGGYLYGVFAPRMVGFGLVDEYQKPYFDLPDKTGTAFKTSALGHKFHASLDKLILADKLKEYKAKKK